MRNLWVFGTSHCLPFNLDSPGWAEIVSQQINLKLINLAQPASDNFFIYHCFREHLDQIQKDDLVIIGWSHYNRKSFVFSPDNIKQKQVLDKSIVYNTKHHQLIRGQFTGTIFSKNLTSLNPNETGREYYDIWFRDYYSEHEQKCNQQSYMHSVQLTCTAKYLPFFFSKESVQDLDLPAHAGFMVDFIKENSVMISRHDPHLNAHGHKLWADHIIKHLDTDLNNPYNINNFGHPRP